MRRTHLQILAPALAVLLLSMVGRSVPAQAPQRVAFDDARAHESVDKAHENGAVEGADDAAEGDDAPDEETAAATSAEESNGNGEKPGGEDSSKNDEAAEETNADGDKSEVEDPRAKRIAEMEAEMKELKARAALEKARQDAELSAMKLEVERLTAETNLESARRKKATAAYGLEADLVAAENALLKQKHAKVKQQTEIAKFEHTARMSETEYTLALANNRDKAKSRIVEQLNYKARPFQGGTLYITDRRIPLNGAITSATATYVTERLHFFNNQSEDPVFIVIDSSPGGSVMAGYRIMKAMEASEAPVHVVVKSFAASMAAIITTLAEESYAYPNAIILHHQMSTFIGGNMTEQSEQLEVAKEWARRIMEPLSEKIGTTPEQFVKDMYANNSTGDWEEFADRAKELGWVGEIVPRIREQAVIKRPIDAGSGGAKSMTDSVLTPVSFDGSEETDERGVRFKRLPRLQPYDFYFVHNPDGYYRY